jgi:hypothetical protein
LISHEIPVAGRGKDDNKLRTNQLHDGVASSSEAGSKYADDLSCKLDGPQIAAPPSLRSIIFWALFAASFLVLRFREKLGENNGMIHAPITRCV